MTKKELLCMVAEAYPGEFPESREQALEHEVGDTLADFIYLELDETLEEDEDGNVDLAEAERLMQVAQSDVRAVLLAIQKEVYI